MPLLGLAALVGLVAAWLTVLLLVFPVPRKAWAWMPALRGPVPASASLLSRFADEQVLSRLPAPSRFFENIGPDRFRREIFRNIRSSTDGHVDDVMGARTAPAWEALSLYARNRVYTHVHRRLPFAVDNFVDHVHRELNDIIVPAQLVDRYFVDSPEQAGHLFLSAFGRELRAALPLAALAGALAAWGVHGLVAGEWALGLVFGASAMVASGLLLLLLVYPRRPVNAWPFRLEGALYRRRRRFLRLLATRLAADALSWRVLSAEFLRGAHAGRVQLIMKREIGGILDTALFKATLQVLIGPEAVVAVKRSAIEKAMDILASTPISPALQESYRVEVERTLQHAAENADELAYEALWEETLRAAWKVIPPLLGAAGFLLGLLAGWLPS